MNTFLIVAVVFVALFVVMSVLRRRGWVSPEEARSLVGDGARLVDVRTPNEFAGGHIDGALNIPVSEIGARADELGSPSVPVVVYCRSGQRSSMAARVLKKRGFEAVHDMGPMTRWPV